MKKRLNTSYARYVSKYRIEILLTTKNAYDMTEERQIAEILAEANAYGVKEEVTQLAAYLLFAGYEAIVAYQRAYYGIIYFYED